MAEKNVARRGLDMDNLVAPDIGARPADAANAVATNQRPGLDGITDNRLFGKKPQTKAEHSDFNSGAKKTVLKAAPSHGASADAEQAHQA